MTISSRTPEGSPNECPVCGAHVHIEPSRPPGDAPCPCCGALLWFVRTEAGASFFDSEPVDALRDRLAQLMSAHLCVLRDRVESTWSFVDDAALDSLDIVDLVMSIEAEFGVSIPDADAEKFHTLDDALNNILRRCSE